VKVFLLLGLLFLTGCALLPAEEPALPPPALVPALVHAFGTAEAVRGDVQRFTDVIAHSVPAREEQLFFSVFGPTVLGIYVSAGDMVSAGDIIAELYRPDIQRQLLSALREEEWTLLYLSQLDDRRMLGTVNEADERRERETLLSSLEIIRMRIAYLRRQDETRFVRASIDGTVTQAMRFAYGMTANPANPVATIADQSQYVFRVSGPAAASIHPGDRFTLYFMHEPYTAEALDPEASGITRTDTAQQEAYLIIIDVYPPSMEGNHTATLRLVAEEALDAVIIPVTALRRTSHRTFVYVIEDGLRFDRDVDVGVTGSAWVEITGGLAEGEWVVN
jgi:multidrug efflux pump subunit AcrA (membrane-fusion protein)